MSDIKHIIETALSYQRAGKLAEAELIYKRVLEIEPKHPDAIHLLGMVAFGRKNYGEAVRFVNEAILLNPKEADYHLNLSSIYLASNQHALAKSHAKIAARLNPLMSEAHYNLGNALFAEGNIEDSISVYQRALDLDPNNQSIWSNYLFAYNFLKKTTSKEIFKINREWGLLLEDKIKKEPQFTFPQSTRRRLKIGYYLPELDTHVTIRYLSPVLAIHNKIKFEVIGYGNMADNKPTPPEIIELFNQWTDINGFSAEEIAKEMRGDQIDILLHPCTFKSRYRGILAYRAAPIQIACTNLVSTTGLVATDYLITDEFISPVNSDESIYTEKLIRLSSFNTYKQFPELKRPGRLPAAENGFITFGSFNNVAKINSEVIITWAEILRRVGNSRIFLKHRSFDAADHRIHIIDAFSRTGITPDRLVFEGFTPNRSDYLRVYDQIDIALDPFPFGGGTVSYEALWMGVPILTIAGQKFMGRLTGSLMCQLGLSDWVTESKDQYISTAKSMVNDLSNLWDLRQHLRINAQNTIFNAKKHVLELEMALESVWENYIDQ
ncbi:MAG: tetratricopeptide repeat protein [Pseudomonadota bacterium]|nr:tetratricopeptide repeat protein [Pseudomonadota bacterium]